MACRNVKHGSFVTFLSHRGQRNSLFVCKEMFNCLLPSICVNNRKYNFLLKLSVLVGLENYGTELRCILHRNQSPLRDTLREMIAPRLSLLLLLLVVLVVMIHCVRILHALLLSRVSGKRTPYLCKSVRQYCDDGSIGATSIHASSLFPPGRLTGLSSLSAKHLQTVNTDELSDMAPRSAWLTECSRPSQTVVKVTSSGDGDVEGWEIWHILSTFLFLFCFYSSILLDFHAVSYTHLTLPTIYSV